LLIGGSPDQGRYPASEVNDGACPEKPVHLRGSQVKTITIRLPDVEAAMLAEIQKGNKEFRRVDRLLLSLIKKEYEKTR